jgi:hypothetical protein
MKKIILLLFLLTSCSLTKKHIDKVHVHLYDHNTCEWSCLFLEDTTISMKEWKQHQKEYQTLTDTTSYHLNKNIR